MTRYQEIVGPNGETLMFDHSGIEREDENPVTPESIKKRLEGAGAGADSESTVKKGQGRPPTVKIAQPKLKKTGDGDEEDEDEPTSSDDDGSDYGESKPAKIATKKEAAPKEGGPAQEAANDSPAETPPVRRAKKTKGKGKKLAVKDGKFVPDNVDDEDSSFFNEDPTPSKPEKHKTTKTAKVLANEQAAKDRAAKKRNRDRDSDYEMEEGDDESDPLEAPASKRARDS